LSIDSPFDTYKPENQYENEKDQISSQIFPYFRFNLLALESDFRKHFPNNANEFYDLFQFIILNHQDLTKTDFNFLFTHIQENIGYYTAKLIIEFQIRY
jgi:hypothetical protein